MEPQDQPESHLRTLTCVTCTVTLLHMILLLHCLYSACPPARLAGRLPPARASAIQTYSTIFDAIQMSIIAIQTLFDANQMLFDTIQRYSRILELHFNIEIANVRFCSLQREFTDACLSSGATQFAIHDFTVDIPCET